MFYRSTPIDRDFMRELVQTQKLFGGTLSAFDAFRQTSAFQPSIKILRMTNLSTGS